MNELKTVVEISGPNGLHGTCDRNSIGDAAIPVHIHLYDGRQLQVPADAVQWKADGSGYIPLTAEQIQAASTLIDRPLQASKQEDLHTVVPLAREKLEIQKKQVHRATVRIKTSVEEWEEVIEVPLIQQEISVERVTINRPVLQAPPIRTEGEVMIIPVMEEVLVVEKRLVLREELRVTTRRREEVVAKREVLRREVATVERIPEK